MQRTSTWSERGSAAVNAGDLATAKACFLEAVKAEGRKASHRLHLALVLEGLGEGGAAAQRLTEALRLDAASSDAARRLASLAGRYAFTGDLQLDPIGLRAALRHDRIDRDVVAHAAMHYLSARSPLGGALAEGRSNGWLEAARTLCLARTSPLLADDLFLDILRSAINIQPEIEWLLTALRRVLLLELPIARFEDRALDGFVFALMQQCWANEYVWAVSSEEAQHLAANPIDLGRLLAGDLAAGRSSCCNPSTGRSRRRWAPRSPPRRQPAYVRKRCVWRWWRVWQRRRTSVPAPPACRASARSQTRPRARWRSSMKPTPIRAGSASA